MGTILGDVKQAIGVDENNLGFDVELLIYINAIGSTLAQLGATEFDALVVDANTNWPSMANGILDSHIKPYFVLRTRKLFDPIASETIAKSFNEHISEFEGRIAHELEQVVI
jgi:hypothetical protein